MKWTVRLGMAAAVIVAAVAVRSVAAAPQTWTGKVSDAMCAGTHQSDPKECVLKCIKDGEKYVLVVDKKVYKIANQTFADLTKFAGVTAVVTGELKNDTITVSKMVAPPVK